LGNWIGKNRSKIKFNEKKIEIKFDNFFKIIKNQQKNIKKINNDLKLLSKIYHFNKRHKNFSKNKSTHW
jgi:hypothetical protein